MIQAQKSKQKKSMTYSHYYQNKFQVNSKGIAFSLKTSVMFAFSDRIAQEANCSCSAR
jgi:hypothetical protein